MGVFTPMSSTDVATRTVRLRTVLGDYRTLAGVCFFALAAQFVTVLMLAAAMAPGYDFGAGAISDLGVIPETAMVFNVTLVAVGLLDLVGGYFYYQLHDRRWLFGLFALAGLGTIGVGLVPLDAGPLHSVFALFAFVFVNLQAVGTATRLSGIMRYLSGLAGAIGLVYVVLMILGDAGYAAAFGPIGHGGTERMIVYPVMLWLLAFGGYLLGTAYEGESASRHL